MRHASLFRKFGLILFSGCLLTLIFPAINLELLAWIAFIPMFVVIQQESRLSAFWLGWGTGVVALLGTLYWVTVAMAVYGGLPKIVSAGLLLALVAYLALYFGLFCMVLRYIQEKTVLPLVLVAPVVWTGLEYLRTYFFIGFPWNLLGYSQFLTPYVTQIADITGVYGVSFLIVLVNAGIYTVLFTAAPRSTKLTTVVVGLGCVGLCIGYRLMKLPTAQAVPPDPSNAVNVAVVQGNIDQGVKWNEQYRQSIVDTYLRLSQNTLAKQPELIVWPETAVPFLFLYDPAYRLQLVRAVQGFATPLLFGGQDIVPAPPPRRYNSFNSAFLLSAQGEVLGKYDKMHLVPFGEYIPFKKVLFFVDKMVTTIGEVLPGTTYTVLSLGEKRFSTVICFEIIFPDLVRKFVDNGAQFLLTITNDAWYGRSSAPYQHFAMAAFRAIENRVAIARAANTGISGFIDPYGRILSKSDLYVEDALVHRIPLRQTTTLYTHYGDLFAIGCSLLTVVAFGYAWLTRRRPIKITSSDM